MALDEIAVTEVQAATQDDPGEDAGGDPQAGLSPPGGGQISRAEPQRPKQNNVVDEPQAEVARDYVGPRGAALSHQPVNREATARPVTHMSGVVTRRPLKKLNFANRVPRFNALAHIRRSMRMTKRGAERVEGAGICLGGQR